MEGSPTAVIRGFQRRPDNVVITAISGRKQLLSQLSSRTLQPAMTRQDTKRRSKLGGRAQDAQPEAGSLPLTSAVFNNH